MTRLVALVLTAMTGFSGLVYEVAWQKYLATLLGSHSEATAAVLAIFLGGLSIGYWLFGLLTRHLIVAARKAKQAPRLLFVYGILETSIGIYIIAFPWLFELIQALSFAIPHGASGFGFAIDVLLTIVLIGPASVLMGGTIPILTQALAKSLEDATRFHAFVYAFNTAGAFVGALAAGFYLIPTLGLVNVMLSMGVINLSAGAVFMLIGRTGGQVVSLAVPAPETDPADRTTGASPNEGLRIYFAVSMLTGFSMMAIQTTAIRIAGLSFGSSQFTFSMVVAVFVLCIALGSFAVSSLKQIPKWLVVSNQWVLCGLFALLYFQAANAPYWVHVLRSIFRDSELAFIPYYAAGFLAVLLMIGVPVLLSGAVLPLLFHMVRREAEHLGDAAGNLYSWNTIGSLVGALLGGYVLFFWFDMHQIYRMSVAALGIAAVLLTVHVYGWRPLSGALLIGCLLIGLVATPKWDDRILYLGLFRAREALPGSGMGVAKFIELNPYIDQINSVFRTDDPIGSVEAREVKLESGGSSLSIYVNGKSDGNSFGDYPTMSLLASLPALFAEKAERGFIIGWGTGVTAGEVASLKTMEHIYVAEISPGVIQAAPYFDFASMNASNNPKIHVIQSDAYRALMRSEGSYDVIISEPSNPWVTSVEMLFSRDFLEVAKGRLSPGGVYCQWLQEYETNTEAIEIVFRTYAAVFDHVAVWRSKSPDLLLIGFNDKGNALDHYRLEERARRPDFKASLERAGIHSFPELLAHEVLPLGVIHAIADEGPMQTLYRPILNYVAGRAFFRGQTGQLPFSGHRNAAEIGRKNSLLRLYARRYGGSVPDEDRGRMITEACRAHGIICTSMLAEWMHEAPDSDAMRRTRQRVEELIEIQSGQIREKNAEMPIYKNANVMKTLFETDATSIIAPDSRPYRKLVSLARAKRASREFEEYYFHASPFSAEALDSIWSRCTETMPTRESCRARSDVGNDSARIEQCLKTPIQNRGCQEGRRQAALISGLQSGK